MTSEVTEVNYLEVSEKLVIFVVALENGSFHDFLVISSFLIWGLK